MAPRPRQTHSPPLPSSRGHVGVLAVTRVSDAETLASVVYYGDELVKRVDVTARGKPRRVWKHRLWQPPRRDACARVDDVIVYGGRKGGLDGVRITTGEQVWVLEHPCRIAAVPTVLPQRQLFVVFEDRVWLRIDARNGKRFESGILERERDADRFATAGAAPIGVFRCAGTTAPGHRVHEAAIELGERRWAIDGWAPAGMLELAAERLVAVLRSRDGKHAAAAVLDAGSLTPVRVVELGGCGAPTPLDGASIVDNCVQVRLGELVHLIDPRGGYELLRLSERGDACFYRADGQVRWRGKL